MIILYKLLSSPTEPLKNHIIMFILFGKYLMLLFHYTKNETEDLVGFTE